MKRFTLLAIALLILSSAYSQNRKKPVYRKDKFNISAPRPWKQLPGEMNAAPYKPSYPPDNEFWHPNENTIGSTVYDLQTSGSTASRIYLYPDFTIGAIWMYGIATPDFGDRGTAYNYFDGNSWGDDPTSRIETVKTGYPSYAPYGTNGEATIAHDFTTPGGLVLCKRDQKGSGNWSQMTIPGPAGQNGLAWPRMVSSGTTHQYLHTIAITRPTSYAGGTLYQGMNGAILYSRSADGGNSWDISNALLTGMTSAEYNGFESNSYAFAEPVGNTIAFVVGDTWTDLFLMKSLDNGDTWTKTVIFQHPYPKFDETKTLVLDTPWVCDGGVAVALDNQGKAHVFFGLMRVLNSDTTDGTTSYFPYTDGLAYWNEDMAPFPDLHFDTLWNQNHIVGYLQDLNGNDTVMEFLGIGTYYLSLSGMPTVSIGPENFITLCFSTVMENPYNDGSLNYRHIWAVYSEDNGQTWEGYGDLDYSIIHNFDECVFPFLSPTVTDNPIGWIGDCNYLLYQHDESPGMAVWGSDPPIPYTTNYMGYSRFYQVPMGIGEIDQIKEIISRVQPNPANQNTEISVELPHPARLGLEIRNSLGQLVYTLSPFQANAGTRYFKLDVSSYSPGMYFYTVTADQQKVTGKMLVQH